MNKLTKELTINKLTKIGASALCGSLAAISAANAGELSVTGGADMTWSSKTGTTTGNGLGIGSNFTLKGSGELDNGWTHDLTIAMANANAKIKATAQAEAMAKPEAKAKANTEA